MESEGKPGRAIVTIDGSRRVAHVARSGDTWWVHIDGRAHEVTLHEQGSSSSADEGSLKAPMPGTVLQVLAKVGQRVREGQHLMTLEAMKMEHKVVAPKAGEITKGAQGSKILVIFGLIVFRHFHNCLFPTYWAMFLGPFCGLEPLSFPSRLSLDAPEPLPVLDWCIQHTTYRLSVEVHIHLPHISLEGVNGTLGFTVTPL